MDMEEGLGKEKEVEDMVGRRWENRKGRKGERRGEGKV